MVESAARSRDDYLRRPDLGRRLSPESRAALAARQAACDLAIVVADGLSSTAVHQNAAPFIAALLPLLQRQKLDARARRHRRAGARRARRRDGEALGARWSLVLIGERPGLSSPDSLGAYLTFAPRRGPHRRRAQLHLEYPPRRPRFAARRLQARLADRPGF